MAVTGHVGVRENSGDVVGVDVGDGEREGVEVAVAAGALVRVGVGVPVAVGPKVAVCPGLAVGSAVTVGNSVKVGVGGAVAKRTNRNTTSAAVLAPSPFASSPSHGGVWLKMAPMVSAICWGALLAGTQLAHAFVAHSPTTSPAAAATHLPPVGRASTEDFVMQGLRCMRAGRRICN